MVVVVVTVAIGLFYLWCYLKCLMLLGLSLWLTANLYRHTCSVGKKKGGEGNGMGKDNKEILMISDWECIVLRTIGGARRVHTLPCEQTEWVCTSEVQ